MTIRALREVMPSGQRSWCSNPSVSVSLARRLIVGNLLLLTLWACDGGPTGPRAPCLPGERDLNCVAVMYPDIASTLFIAADDDGLYTFSVGFDPMPIEVWGGSEDYVLERSFHVILPFEVEVVSITTFIGLEAGDRVEAAIEIYTDANVQLRSRSYHGHVPASYEGYDDPLIFPLNAQPNTSELLVGILGRVTGTHDNLGDARHGELSAVMHWGFRFNAIRRR